MCSVALIFKNKYVLHKNNIFNKMITEERHSSCMALSVLPVCFCSVQHHPFRHKRPVFQQFTTKDRPFTYRQERTTATGKTYAFTFMDCTSSSISSGYSLISLSMMKLRLCWNLFFSVAMKSSLFGTLRGLYLS